MSAETRAINSSLTALCDVLQALEECAPRSPRRASRAVPQPQAHAAARRLARRHESHRDDPAVRTTAAHVRPTDAQLLRARRCQPRGGGAARRGGERRRGGNCVPASPELTARLARREPEIPALETLNTCARACARQRRGRLPTRRRRRRRSTPWRSKSRRRRRRRRAALSAERAWAAACQNAEALAVQREARGAASPSRRTTTRGTPSTRGGGRDALADARPPATRRSRARRRMRRRSRRRRSGRSADALGDAEARREGRRARPTPSGGNGRAELPTARAAEAEARAVDDAGGSAVGRRASGSALAAARVGRAGMGAVDKHCRPRRGGGGGGRRRQDIGGDAPVAPHQAPRGGRPLRPQCPAEEAALRRQRPRPGAAGNASVTPSPRRSPPPSRPTRKRSRAPARATCRHRSLRWCSTSTRDMVAPRASAVAAARRVAAASREELRTRRRRRAPAVAGERRRRRRSRSRRRREEPSRLPRRDEGGRQRRESDQRKLVRAAESLAPSGRRRLRPPRPPPNRGEIGRDGGARTRRGGNREAGGGAARSRRGAHQGQAVGRDEGRVGRQGGKAATSARRRRRRSPKNDAPVRGGRRCARRGRRRRQALANGALVDLKVPTPRARRSIASPETDGAGRRRGGRRRSRRRSRRRRRRRQRRRRRRRRGVGGGGDAAWKQAYANDENEEPAEAEKVAAEKAPDWQTAQPEALAPLVVPRDARHAH